ncbi:MAG: hypothetical protein OEY93_02115 [Anaerolineae bacterium]|nr:hypothetical protein [Anaerolineae bacterium]
MSNGKHLPHRNSFFRSISIVSLLFLMLVSAVGADSAAAATGDPVLINEVFASHTGTDDTEFIEFYGTPGASLDGLSIIMVEGENIASQGVIKFRLDFGASDILGSNGFFLVGNPVGLAANYGVTPNIGIAANALQNDSETFALVQTASITGSSYSGSEVVLDAVALDRGHTGDVFYFGAPVIGPDGSYFPAGARRAVDGIDTDTAADWVISNFNLGPDNTPTAGDTPPPPPPPVVTIMEIQGSGQFSGYDSVKVETSGVVILYTGNGAHFWLQDPSGDGDSATSDGIFVSGGGYPDSGPKPAVGDFIRIIATVQEQQYYPGLPLTRLNSVNLIEVLSSGNAMPAAVMLTNLPNVSIQNGIDFWEPLEGMLVGVEYGKVVAGTDNYGEFAMLSEADAVPGSGYFPQTKQILIRGLGDGKVDYNPERILVDDSTYRITVMPGDEIYGFVGVVDYTFNNFKLQPKEQTSLTQHNLPSLPASKRTDGKGNLAITSFNVENLFDRINEPGKDDPIPSAFNLNRQLNKLVLAIEIELELPEIIVAEEFENQAILQTLGDLVNAKNGTNYTAVSFETSDARGIEVGFLYDAGRVELLDAYQMSGPAVEAAFGPSSPSPGREPIVGVFNFNGKKITIIGNHFKSKGGDNPLFGIIQPPNRDTEAQRKMQAQVVRDFVNSILDSKPNARVMVTGDLNDFQFAEPGEGANHPLGILEGTGGEIKLTNLAKLVLKARRYSYVYEGNSQVLDHMLVSPKLLEDFVGADYLHFNAGYPYTYHYDANTPIVSSDHDPLEGRFKIK